MKRPIWYPAALIGAICALAIGVACSKTSGGSPGESSITDTTDLQDALAGHPTQRTINIANAIQSALTPSEMNHWLNINWSQEATGDPLADPVIVKALVATAGVLDAAPPVVVQSASVSAPVWPSNVGLQGGLVCNPDCAQCLQNLQMFLQQAIAMLEQQGKAAEATCILSAAASGGAAAPFVCGALAAGLVIEAAVLYGLVQACATSQQAQDIHIESPFSSAGNLISMCAPGPDGGTDSGLDAARPPDSGSDAGADVVDDAALAACHASCQGCCDPTGTCLPGNAANACGLGGSLCVQCSPPAGQGSVAACTTNGICATGCGPLTCTNGCCDFTTPDSGTYGTCQPGTADTTCGFGYGPGTSCANCAVGGTQCVTCPATAGGCCAGSPPSSSPTWTTCCQ